MKTRTQDETCLACSYQNPKNAGSKFPILSIPQKRCRANSLHFQIWCLGGGKWEKGAQRDQSGRNGEKQVGRSGLGGMTQDEEVGRGSGELGQLVRFFFLHGQCWRRIFSLVAQLTALAGRGGTGRSKVGGTLDNLLSQKAGVLRSSCCNRRSNCPSYGTGRNRPQRPLYC